MSAIVAVQDGHVTQCPQCFRLMGTAGETAAKAEALIKGADHLTCPYCTVDMLRGSKEPRVDN